jgi:hypothetical protein
LMIEELVRAGSRPFRAQACMCDVPPPQKAHKWSKTHKPKKTRNKGSPTRAAAATGAVPPDLYAGHCSRRRGEARCAWILHALVPSADLLAPRARGDRKSTNHARTQIGTQGGSHAFLWRSRCLPGAPMRFSAGHPEPALRALHEAAHQQDGCGHMRVRGRCFLCAFCGDPRNAAPKGALRTALHRKFFSIFARAPTGITKGSDRARGGGVGTPPDRSACMFACAGVAPFRCLFGGRMPFGCPPKRVSGGGYGGALLHLSSGDLVPGWFHTRGKKLASPVRRERLQNIQNVQKMRT